MATDVTKVYSRFLQKISDFKILENPSYVPNLLLGFYLSATSNFIQCEKDLSTVLLNEDDTDSPLLIAGDISNQEIEIISLLMVIEYLRPAIVSDETIKQALSDSDFKASSQANHINQLKDLQRYLVKEVNVKINNYTYQGAIYDKK